HTTEKEGPVMDQIKVDELKKRIDSGENLEIWDVRNPDEHEKGAIPGAKLMPLPELPKHLDDLKDMHDREILVHCQKGGRSARACGIMKSRGFEKPVNIEGEYEAWEKLS